MKVLILMFLLYTVSVFTQSTFIEILRNNTTPGVYDTVYVWDFNKSYNMVFITVENLSATVACTLQVRGVTFIRTDADNQWNINDAWQSPISDTTYANINVRDNTWTTVSSLIVAASSATTYWLAKEKLEGLKIYLTNTTGGNCRVIVEGSP